MFPGSNIQSLSPSLQFYNASPEASNNTNTDNEPEKRDPLQSKINDEQINKISSEASLNMEYLADKEVKTPMAWRSASLEKNKKIEPQPHLPHNLVSSPLSYGKVKIIKSPNNSLEGNWKPNANSEFKSRLNVPVIQSKPVNLNEHAQHIKQKTRDIYTEFYNLLRQGKVEICKRKLAAMFEGDFVPNIGFCNKMINVFIDTNHVKEAYEIMAMIDKPESVNKPNTHTYNILMKIYLKDTYLIYTLQQNGIMLSNPNYSTLRLEHQKNIDLIKECRGLYEIMLADNIQPDIITFNTMLNIYGKNGELKDCQALLEEMRNKQVLPNTSIYNTVLMTAVKKGTLNDCMAIWKEMQQESVPRNVATYTILMRYHANTNNLDAALALLKEMKQKMILPDEVTYALLIGLSLKCENFQCCDVLLKELQSVLLKSGISKPTDIRKLYHEVISTYLSKGRVGVSSVLQNMEIAGLDYDIETFNILLKYYVETNDLQSMNDLLGDMEKFNVKPNDVSREILSPVQNSMLYKNLVNIK